jgi:hypothetical protein
LVYLDLKVIQGCRRVRFYDASKLIYFRGEVKMKAKRIIKILVLEIFFISSILSGNVWASDPIGHRD